MCETTGAPLADVIRQMLAAGLALEDVAHLERLSDPRVLARVPCEPFNMTRNRRQDVVVYLQTWADLLEEGLERTAPEAAPLVAAAGAAPSA